MNQFNVKRYLLLRNQVKLIKSSGHFDENWYLQQYQDVANARCNPVKHYLQFGAKEGRDPGPKFSTRLYLEKNPDVAKSGINPLYHYVKWGMDEGRDFPEPAAMPPPVDVDGSQNTELQERDMSSEDVAKLVEFLLDEKSLLELQLRQVHEELAEYADKVTFGVELSTREHELKGQLAENERRIESQQRQLQAAAETEQGLRDRLQAVAETEQGLRDRLQEAAETEQGLRVQLQEAAETGQGLRDRLQEAAEIEQGLRVQLQEAAETEQGLRDRLQAAAETEQDLRDRQQEAAETEQGLRNRLQEAAEIELGLQDQLGKAMKERDQQENLSSESKKLAKELTAHVENLSTTIRQLECQIDERDHRQELLDKLVVRAEAQIDFIKDILFAEKSLQEPVRYE